MLWEQNGDIVRVTGERASASFHVPHDFNLSETHIAVLTAVEFLAFAPHEHVPDCRAWRTPPERMKIGLAFSGGVDSCVAAMMLPEHDTSLVVHVRKGTENDNVNVLPALSIPTHANRVAVYSDFEGVRNRYGFPVGCTSQFGYLAPVVLLADYLGLGCVATGDVLEETYLGGGSGFRRYDLSHKYRETCDRLKQSGLLLSMPCGGLSEVVTQRIASLAEIGSAAHSCVRLRRDGDKWVPCGECYKCFRKGALSGRPVPASRETREMIVRRRALSSMAWAAQRCQEFDKGIRDFLMGHDVGFCERWYEKGGRLLAGPLANRVAEFLAMRGVESMSENDVGAMASFLR